MVPLKPGMRLRLNNQHMPAGIAAKITANPIVAAVEPTTYPIPAGLDKFCLSNNPETTAITNAAITRKITFFDMRLTPVTSNAKVTGSFVAKPRLKLSSQLAGVRGPSC
jgi:hypothetical protein